MLNALYNQRILELAGNIKTGKLDAPQASAQAVSRLCGSKIAVDLSLDADGKIADYAQRVEACALGQASAAIVANHIIGTSAAEFRHIAAAMRAMLKQGAPPPQWQAAPDKWRDFEILTPVRDFKNRHASTLLVFDAVEDCLTQLESDVTK